MGLREDIQPYIDGNGLMAPNPISPGTIAGSGNGIMYTSEVYVMYQKSGQLTNQDMVDFDQKMVQCINPQGMLCRVPIGQDGGQEQVDDHYGLFNGCKMLKNVQIPRIILFSMIKNLGFMNNVNPGYWTLNSFMPRQPQLMAAMIAAAFPSWKSPLHILARLLCAPLFALSSLVIATSCIGAPISDLDARRLSWHLQNTLKPVSLLCWLASKIWLRRLYTAYPTGMRGVAAGYYQPYGDNPYSKYWID